MEIKLPLTSRILNEIALLDRFRGEWSASNGIPPKRLGRIVEAARIESVAASCRLAGIRVTDEEVASLLHGGTSTHREAGEVLGYAAASRVELPDASRLLRAEDLRRLHAVLDSGDPETDELSPWRTSPHQREAFDAQGRAMGRVFPTLPPRMIEDKVEDLLTWLELELHSRDGHPLPAISAFVVGFLSACPFETLNGRMARLLIPMLLRRSGYAHLPYASVESQIEDLRDTYHEAFDQAQTRFWQGQADLEPWIDFVLEVLRRHRSSVEHRARLERRSLELPPLQQAILEAVREHGTVDAGMLIRATGANRNTLKDNLRRMVDRGMLEKSGRRRGTRYQIGNEVR